MEFSELVKKRYSCKSYSDRPLEQEKLDVILEAGRQAPTAKNFQEQHIYVARTAEALATIDRITPCRYGAPCVLVVAFDTTNTFTYPGEQRDSGAEDASIVTTHMMLAATAAGVDSCWVNFFDPAQAARELALPEHEEVLAFLDLGYATPEAGPLENHGLRKPLSETVTYL